MILRPLNLIAHTTNAGFRLCAISALAVVVAGCGIIPAVVQKSTQVAMLPVTTAASSLSRDARLMSRSFEYGATRVGRGLEVGAASLGRSAQSLGYSVERAAATAQQATRPPLQFNTGRSTQPTIINQRPSAARAQSASTSAHNAARAQQNAATTVVPPPQIDILPPTVLAQLTEDQAGLQRAAQSEAFSAPVGEEIYWEVEGRTGSAVAESENAMGSFVCRTFIQTLTLEKDNTTESEAVMCRNDNGVWTDIF